MNTKKQFLIGIMLVGLATTVVAQESKISPVYIPGTKLDAKKTIKTSTSKSTTGITKSSTSPSYFGTTGSSISNRLPVVPAKSATSQCTGCDCGSSGCDSGGCDSGGIGCNCGQGGYDGVGKNYLDCGCDSGSCGCGGGRSRVGSSFFGAVRNLIPIKVSFNRQGEGGCEGTNPGNCQTFGGRLLPFTARLCSNHCARYISLFGGYVDLEDYDGVLPPDTRLIDFNGGWQLGLKRGRIFDNGIRLESEFTFRHNTNDSYSLGNFVGMDFVPTMTVDATDSIFQISNLTNVLFDLQNFSTDRTTPYVGFGLGGVYADGDIVTALPTNDSIDDYAFAYQLIVGLNRRINDTVSGFAEFRHFGSSGVDVENAAGMMVGEFDLQSNNLIFGLQFIRPNRCCN